MSSTDYQTAEHATAGYDANLAEVARRDAEDRAIFEAAQAEIRNANWLSVLFNPLAKTSPVLFRRAQMIVWLLRFLSVVVGVILMMFGQPVPAAIIIGATLLLTWISSTVQHISRLDHAGKPVYLGLIAAVPLLVLLGLGLAEGSKAARVWNGMMAMQEFSAALQGDEAGQSRQAGAERRGPPRGGPGGGRGQGGFGQMLETFNIDLARVFLGWFVALVGAAVFTWVYAARVGESTRDQRMNA